MKFSVDSNYLICGLQSWNSHHEATLADLESRLTAGHSLHLIPHTLLETYSVMQCAVQSHLWETTLPDEQDRE